MAKRSRTTNPSTQSGVTPRGTTSTDVGARNYDMSGTVSAAPLPALNALLGDSSMYSRFLAFLSQSGAGVNNEYLQTLIDAASQNTGQSGTHSDDLQKALIDMYLQNLTAQEQRAFDKSQLQEQRLYDSPLNQLARLMGAGISRDAALQMIQQGQDPALVGSGADATAPDTGVSPTQSAIQTASTIAGFVSTVGNLVSLGFSIPQAIQQTHYLRNLNALGDRQRAAYDSAGKAYSILSAAGAAAETFDSVGSAVTAISKLADGGNSMAKQFISNGEIATLQENAPFCSNVLRDFYKSENGSSMFRKEMRRMDLQNELTNAQVETEYQNIMESLQNILESDERIKEIRENVRIKKALGTQEEYAAHFAQFQDKVLTGLENMSSENGDVFDLMSAAQFNEIWMHFQEVSAQCADHSKFQKFLQDNWNVACDLATINAVAASTYRANYGEKDDEPTFMSAILRFHRLMSDSGMIDDLRAVGAIAGKATLNALTPVKTK